MLRHNASSPLAQLTGASSNPDDSDEYDSPRCALFKPFETLKSRYSMQSWSHKVGFLDSFRKKIITRCRCIGEENTGPTEAVEIAIGDGSNTFRHICSFADGTSK
jgi:hypothetical protein